MDTGFLPHFLLVFSLKTVCVCKASLPKRTLFQLYYMHFCTVCQRFFAHTAYFAPKKAQLRFCKIILFRSAEDLATMRAFSSFCRRCLPNAFFVRHFSSKYYLLRQIFFKKFNVMRCVKLSFLAARKRVFSSFCRRCVQTPCSLCNFHQNFIFCGNFFTKKFRLVKKILLPFQY